MIIQLWRSFGSLLKEFLNSQNQYFIVFLCYKQKLLKQPSLFSSISKMFDIEHGNIIS